MLAPDRTVYYRRARFACDSSRCSRRHRAVNNGEIRLVPPDIFRYLTNEFFVAERKTNMHDIATFHGCGQVNIYFENSMSLLDNLGQRFPNFAQPDNYHCLTRLFLFQCENEFKP